MKSFNKRIDDLGDHLSPTDIVLRELHEMARVSSTTEYLASLKDGPTSNWPLNRMTRQARRAVEKSMKGMPSDAIEERVREAVRDVLFLWDLYLQVNLRIHDDLRTALPMMIHLAADVRFRLLDESRRADAARAWLAASRDLPYPLDAQTAAAVEAAIAHQVESWSVLNDGDTIDEWVYQELGEQAPDGDLDESAARISRRVERALRRLVRTEQVKPGKVVSLHDSPHPFLSTAPLLDGRWIDITVLELAELGAILADGGCALRGSGDLHTLAWEEFVRTDAQGERSPIDDASWHDARDSARDRVRSYRGGRRVFDGQDYVNLALYQRWRSRSLGSRLDASVENGFVVSSWNHWMKNRGLKAALAGIAVRPIDSHVDAEAWTVHDAKSARGLQSDRTRLFVELRSASIDRETATQGPTAAAEAAIPWQDGAVHVLTLIEGLAAAVQAIRRKHFRNGEIVFTELAERLERFRADLREVVKTFESQRDWADPLVGYLGFHALGQVGETANSKHQESVRKQVNPHVVQTGKRIAKEIIRDARFDSFIHVRDRDAAEKIIDEELDEFLA